MRDLSDNIYLKIYKKRSDTLSVHSFLYTERVAEKKVDEQSFIFSIRNLLSITGFDIQLTGYKCLARLVAYYLAKDGYDENAAIEDIAFMYGLPVQNIVCNILDSINRNKHFEETASKRLGMQIKLPTDNKISTAVEVLGALFTVYYNMKVDALTETDRNKTLNYAQVIFNGK